MKTGLSFRIESIVDFRFPCHGRLFCREYRSDTRWFRFTWRDRTFYFRRFFWFVVGRNIISIREKVGHCQNTRMVWCPLLRFRDSLLTINLGIFFPPVYYWSTRFLNFLSFASFFRFCIFLLCPFFYILLFIDFMNYVYDFLLGLFFFKLLRGRIVKIGLKQWIYGL